jgi:hypothetical protein
VGFPASTSAVASVAPVEAVTPFRAWRKRAVYSRPVATLLETSADFIVDCVVVEASKGKAERIVGVRVGFKEAQLRQQVRDSGAKWDTPARLWRWPLRAARRLGLLDRVVN